MILIRGGDAAMPHLGKRGNYPSFHSFPSLHPKLLIISERRIVRQPRSDAGIVVSMSEYDALVVREGTQACTCTFHHEFHHMLFEHT